MRYIPNETGTSRPRPRATLIDVAFHARCMNAHISRCVPNIIVMRTLETRNSCLPRKEKTCDVTLRQREPDVRPARCYRAKNSISVACRCLPLQCSKKAALACLTGASAPGTPCAVISSLPISIFCAAVNGTCSLTCLNPRL